MTEELSPERTRRWRAPPPLLRRGELTEGAEVLAELTGDRAVLLWKTLRNVTLWSTAASDKRASLFAAGSHRKRIAEILASEAQGTLHEPLKTLASILDPSSQPPREVISLACLAIAQWAEESGASATALAFTQAAALASPADPALAYRVGRTARARAENARSESWFRRAIMLARQNRDWHCYTLSYLGLGNLYFQRGNMPAAQRTHLKGLRSAHRARLRELEGVANHGLFAISLELGQHELALGQATQALRAYGRSHPRVPALSHDVACLWIDLGQFARALPVLDAVLPHITSDHERAVVLGNAARAAAGSGALGRFRELRFSALELLELPTAEAGAAQALLALARGEALLGEHEDAIIAARRAVEVARKRGERKVEMTAGTVLESVSRRVARGQPTVDPPPRQDPVLAAPADELAAELIGSLCGAAG